jgi:hypothetical protein
MEDPVTEVAALGIAAEKLLDRVAGTRDAPELPDAATAAGADSDISR